VKVCKKQGRMQFEVVEVWCIIVGGMNGKEFLKNNIKMPFA
jgi:hypothetical protein